MTALFLFIGSTELLLIAGIALLLFGGKKVPEMMRGLGQGVKQFKEGMNEDIQKEEEEEKQEGTEETIKNKDSEPETKKETDGSKKQ